MGFGPPIRFPYRRRLGIPDDLGAQIEAGETTRGPVYEPPIALSNPAIERMPLPVRPSVVEPLGAGIASRMQPETVTPVAEPIARMGVRPDFVGDAKEAALADPNLRRPAIIDRGVTPSEYDYVNAPTRMVPGVPDRPIVKRGGVGGTLKHMGAGLLQGLAIGAPMGGGQAIGAGLTGAILGGINPQAISDIKFNRMTLPEYERQRSSAEEEIAKREQTIGRIGQRTGYDPVTGQKTPQRADRDLDREIREKQLQSVDEHKSDTREDRAYDSWVKHGDPAKPLTSAEAIRMGRPDLAGQKSPATMKAAQRAAATEYSKTEMREDGTEWGLRKDTGQWEALTDTEGKPFKRFVKPDKPERTELTPGEKLAQERFDQNERQQQQIRHETLQAKVGTLQAAKTKRANVLNSYVNKITDPTAKAEARADADAELQAMDAEIADTQAQAKANNPNKLAKKAAKAGVGATSKIDYGTAKSKAQEALTAYLSRPGITDADRQRAQAAFAKHFPQ